MSRHAYRISKRIEQKRTDARASELITNAKSTDKRTTKCGRMQRKVSQCRRSRTLTIGTGQYADLHGCTQCRKHWGRMQGCNWTRRHGTSKRTQGQGTVKRKSTSPNKPVQAATTACQNRDHGPIRLLQVQSDALAICGSCSVMHLY